MSILDRHTVRFLTLAAGLLADASAAQTVASRPYDVEAGTIVINKSVKNSMMTVEGVDTIYFRDWGRTRATWSTSKSTNRFTPGETVDRKFTLLEGTTITSVNLATMRGTRMKNPLADAVGRMTRPQAEELAARMGRAMNTKTSDAGEERVAGRTCKVQESTTEMGALRVTTRTCLWKNIVLKTAANGGGSDILEEATSVTLGDVPSDRLAPPKGATISEMPGRRGSR